MSPNPRTVSRELLARKDFIPATTLNLLAAAWLQFEVHDWMSHGENDVERLSGRSTLKKTTRGHSTRCWSAGPTWATRRTGDRLATATPRPTGGTASQVYGSNPAIEKMLRTFSGGHLKLTPEGELPFDPPNMPPIEGEDFAGVTGNWWLGLAMMHTLFMREHNSICDHLAAAYPSWTDDELFDHARLINAALMAKIHTVEWTPTLLADSDLETAMRANWWGFYRARSSVEKVRPADQERGN